MRKSRIKISIDKKITALIKKDPDKFFLKLKDLSISIPSWAKLTLLIVHPGVSAEFDFFEDAKSFFLTYTKRTLKNNSDLKFICLSQEHSSEWKSFIPPTLIGTNLDTKMRKL